MKIMGRVRFIEHHARQILFLDLSYCTLADVFEAIQTTRHYLASQSEHSVRSLIDVTAAPFGIEAVTAIKELSKANRPYIAASAIVGLNRVQSIILETIEKYSDRTFTLFGDIEEAKNWLAKT